jgi:hypothetical protein
LPSSASEKFAVLYVPERFKFAAVPDDVLTVSTPPRSGRP